MALKPAPRETAKALVGRYPKVLEGHRIEVGISGIIAQ